MVAVNAEMVAVNLAVIIAILFPLQVCRAGSWQGVPVGTLLFPQISLKHPPVSHCVQRGTSSICSAGCWAASPPVCMHAYLS